MASTAMSSTTIGILPNATSIPGQYSNGLSQSDKIALACGVAIGVPSVLIALIALVHRARLKEKPQAAGIVFV